MNNRDQTHYQEAQIIMQNLHHHLVTHAVSVKGRLSPAEEDTLANIFHAQINLQALLAEIFSDSRMASPGQSSSSEQEAHLPPALTSLAEPNIH